LANTTVVLPLSLRTINTLTIPASCTLFGLR
jgi:hypothetical protein